MTINYFVSSLSCSLETGSFTELALDWLPVILRDPPISDLYNSIMTDKQVATFLFIIFFNAVSEYSETFCLGSKYSCSLSHLQPSTSFAKAMEAALRSSHVQSTPFTEHSILVQEATKIYFLILKGCNGKTDSRIQNKVDTAADPVASVLLFSPRAMMTNRKAS